MNIFSNILDFVLPAKCLVCKKLGEDFCVECLAQCRKAERECEDWIFPIFDYRDTRIKKSIWMLKYKGRTRLAKIFALSMKEIILEELAELEQFSDFREPLIMPIPLSQKSLKKRGYNQAALICKHLSMEIPDLYFLPNTLIKTRETQRQANIKNRNKRLRNLVNAFSIKRPEMTKGRNVILIDDVTTTGATLKEAKRVLKKGGSRKVVAFTFAH